MPVFQAPGVYVLEIPGTPPIQGVGTSTAGFIGTVEDTVIMPILPDRQENPIYYIPEDHFPLTPVNTPILLTNFDQFKKKFGDFQTGNEVLAHAVFGFFLNGGTRCWVTRVASGTDADQTNLRQIQALDTFKPIDEIAIVAIPGATADAVQNAILDHCENEHLQDRFAILDGRQTSTLTKTAIQGGARDSTYGAIYFPWIKVLNPIDGKNKIVAPSGHIAGVYARVDSLRGVHKAPANEVIRGALGVELLLSREDQAGLNPDDINVIRQFNGNTTIYGARTLGGKEKADLLYINVRRLLLFLRESIDEGTQFAVFEPNSPPLWQKIRRSVTAFLTNVWRDGALFGNTPEEAFFVRCDETTNPPEVRDIGQVITEIGVAPVKPAEFVIFRISQITSGETA